MKTDDIEIAECVHCNSITLNPQDDTCECGKEMYPITRQVKAGTRVLGVSLEAVELSQGN